MRYFTLLLAHQKRLFHIAQRRVNVEANVAEEKAHITLTGLCNLGRDAREGERRKGLTHTASASVGEGDCLLSL